MMRSRLTNGVVSGLVMALCCLAPCGARAADTSGVAPKATSITQAATTASGTPTHTPKKEFHWSRFLGPFHSVILHLPIGFITIVCILEVAVLRRSGVAVHQLIGLVVWLSAISSVVTAFLGWARSLGGGYEITSLDMHRLFGLLVAGLTVVTVVVHRRVLQTNGAPAWRWTFRALLGGCLGTVIIAGHFGGNLTHGKDYLMKEAPSMMRELFDGKTDETAPSVVGLDAGQREFLKTIQPIFAAKCYKCHGPDKQKGKFRLDVKEIALAGGESNKPAIKPGAPLESNLVRLITLPADSEDAMPPAGKEPLTGEEILAIIRWIQTGARFVESAAPAAVK